MSRSITIDVAAVQRMREAHMTWQEIANSLGATMWRVRYAADPKYRDAMAARQRNHGRNKVAEPARHYGLTEHRAGKASPVGRPKAGEPDPVISSAAAAFARGEIDRAELMRRIGKP